MAPSKQRLLALIAIVSAAYANSFRGVFLLDDPIYLHEGLAQPLGSLVSCLSGTRSLVQCTLRLDYLRGGLAPASYHATNLLVHLGAALLLYGVVRRTLALGALAERRDELAAATTLLWALHPLQTESVTYVIQRAESMVGLLYLLVIYAALRRFRGSRAWSIVAVLAALLGMCTKPVMVTVPVAVLLLDRCFVAGGFVPALRQRPLLHAGLFATLGWLYVVLDSGHALVATAGNAGFVSAGITPGRYFLSQGGVILHYLRLVLLPWPLCLDYRWPAATGLAALVPTVLYVVGALAAAVLTLRRHPAGFLGAMFFLVLLPSSSVLPIADLAAEHRMYLALAPALLGLVVVVARLAPRARLALVLVLACCFGALTHLRNRDYHGLERMYAQIVSLRPSNDRAQFNLGNEYLRQHRPADALPHYERALAIGMRNQELFDRLSAVYLELGRREEARRLLQAGIERHPTSDTLRMTLAEIAFLDGDLPQARALVELALRFNPRNASAHTNLGTLLSMSGAQAEALASFERALAIEPRSTSALNGRGLVFLETGRVPEAVASFRAALAVDPADERVQRNLARATAALR